MGKSTISMAMLNSFLYGLEGSMKQQSIRQVQGIQPTISSFIYPHYIPIHIFISHKKKTPFLLVKSCQIINPNCCWLNHHFSSPNPYLCNVKSTISVGEILMFVGEITIFCQGLSGYLT
jgi:hypothetical protein